MKTSLKSEVKSLESAINDVNSKLLGEYSVDLINIRQRLLSEIFGIFRTKPLT